MLWDVQMEIKLKLSVMFVLSLGLISMIANLVRLKFLPQIVRGYDTSYELRGDIIWSIIECGAGMVTSCVATYRPLVKIMFSKDKVNSRYRDTFALDGVFCRGAKTVIVANKVATASEEDILGANGLKITKTIEFQVEKSSVRTNSSFHTSRKTIYGSEIDDTVERSPACSPRGF